MTEWVLMIEIPALMLALELTMEPRMDLNS